MSYNPLVVVEPNKGAFVKSFTLEEVVHYLEIQEAHERLVCKKAAQNLTDAELKEMSDVLKAMLNHLNNNEFDANVRKTIELNYNYLL